MQLLGKLRLGFKGYVKQKQSQYKFRARIGVRDIETRFVTMSLESLFILIYYLD
jgi:hypothetical protein